VCTPGTDGEVREIELELKLIADIGFVGMPNAGKSTLMSQITHVPVKIGAYPFTTLYPNLSYVRYEDFERLLVADIPGIIENAHLNKGLGIAFLRHIERSSVLVYVIDASGIEGRDPWDDFAVLRREIEAYRPEMLQKPFLVALNKIDEEGAEENFKVFKERFPFGENLLFCISAKEGQGLEPLLEAMRRLMPHCENATTGDQGGGTESPLQPLQL
jgi:GTP-binding protein